MKKKAIFFSYACIVLYTIHIVSKAALQTLFSAISSFTENIQLNLVQC